MNAEAHYDRGNESFVAGDLPAALAAYEAALRALTPADDALAPDLFENLGLTLWKLDRFRPAARALLRTLDGNPTAREQTLRVLVTCLFRAGQPLDGERYLTLYEARFGRHPDAWTRT